MKSSVVCLGCMVCVWLLCVAEVAYSTEISAAGHNNLVVNENSSSIAVGFSLDIRVVEPLQDEEQQDEEGKKPTENTTGLSKDSASSETSSETSSEPSFVKGMLQRAFKGSEDVWSGVLGFSFNNESLGPRNFYVYAGLRYMFAPFTKSIRAYGLSTLGYAQRKELCQRQDGKQGGESCVNSFVPWNIYAGVHVSVTPRFFLYLENKVVQIIPYFRLRYDDGSSRVVSNASVTGFHFASSLALGFGVKI